MTTQTIRVSPFARLPFDIFNNEHQSLIPETMDVLRDTVATALSHLEEMEQAHGAFFSALTIDPHNPFGDTSFRVQLQSYTDETATSQLKQAHNAAESALEFADWDAVFDKSATALGVLERYYRLDNPGDETDLAWSSLENQASIWMRYQLLSALARKSEVARYLVDNGKEHSWERVAETTVVDGQMSANVFVHLVIPDPRTATHIKMMLSNVMGLTTK